MLLLHQQQQLSTADRRESSPLTTTISLSRKISFLRAAAGQPVASGESSVSSRLYYPESESTATASRPWSTIF
jgi:hypothetical protein